MNYRLIDGNQIYKQLKKKADASTNHGDGKAHDAYAYTASIISKADTIEAIPVSWIKERLKSEKEFDQIVYRSSVYQEILDDWKEENGTDRSDQ